MIRLLLSIAVLPAFLLMWYVYAQDKIEKEPPGLLLKLLIAGALSVISAIILETIGTGLLSYTGLPESGTAYNFIMCFFVIALSEELGKYFFLKKCTWNHRAFNYRFDGIVYAVSVSLGFAVVENIMYVFQHGIKTGILRALTAVPAHAIFAVFMGCFYGQAKMHDNLGNHFRAGFYRKMAIVMPIVLHGFYDFCAFQGTVLYSLLFIAFIILMDIITIRRVKNSSARDVAI